MGDLKTRLTHNLKTGDFWRSMKSDLKVNDWRKAHGMDEIMEIRPGARIGENKIKNETPLSARFAAPGRVEHDGSQIALQVS